MPHALRSPSNETRRQDVLTSDLPFFPLPEQIDRLTDDLSIHVERSATGTVVDVRSDGEKAQQHSAEVRSYLLDASGLKTRIETLELLWTAETPAFLADVIIETSNDLVNWSPLTTAAVARLSYQDYRLDQNKIRLPRANSRYLRLHWPVGHPSGQISGIRVLTQQSYSLKRPAQRQIEVTALLASERRYSIDLQGVPPVSAVIISLPDQNSLAAVRLSSAETVKGPQRERWRGLTYNLNTDGNSLTNSSITLSPWRQRYWQLSLDASEATLGAPPRLEFFWQPDRLIFLAQGEGPYILAYGNRQAEATSFPIDKLLKTSAVEPQAAQPGAGFELGGKGALSARPPLPWKEYSLWAVLGLGVVLIGGMSFSLYRKLKETDLDAN